MPEWKDLRRLLKKYRATVVVDVKCLYLDSMEEESRPSHVDALRSQGQDARLCQGAKPNGEAPLQIRGKQTRNVGRNYLARNLYHGVLTEIKLLNSKLSIRRH